MVIIFEGGKKRILKAVTNSSHEVIELRGNSANHLHALPINKKGKRLNLTDSWEMFLKENGLHKSTKFLRCSCGSSLANPLKSPFNYKSCNMVLVMWNSALPLLGVNIWPQHLPLDENHWCWDLGHRWGCNIILMAHLAPITTTNTHAFWKVYTINKIKLNIKLVITTLKRTKNSKWTTFSHDTTPWKQHHFDPSTL